jgi:hypothetical protein
MGAYSNPEIIVDTQSGQHWRNLQQTISETSEKVVNAFVQVAEKNKKIKAEVDSNVQKIRSFANKAGKLNPSLNIQEATKPLVDEYERIANDIAFGKSKDIAQDRLKLRNIEASIDDASGMIQNIDALGDKYSKGIKNFGGVNGIATLNDPNLLEFMSVASNDLKGKLEIQFDFNNNYKPMLKGYSAMKDEDDKETIGYREISSWFDSDKLNRMLDENGGLITNPDATVMFDNLKKNNIDLFDEKGRLLKDFALPVEVNEKEISKMTTTNNKADKDVFITHKATYLEGDKEKILAKVDNQLEAQLAGLEATNQLSAFYNFYVANNDPSKGVDLNTPLTPEQKKQAKEWLGDAFIKTIPKVKDETVPVKIVEETKKTEIPKAQKGSSSQNKPKKVSESKAFIQELFDTPPNERGDKLMGKGTIISGPGKDANFIIDDSGNWRRAIKLEGMWVPDGPVLKESAVKTRVGYKPSLTVKK